RRSREHPRAGSDRRPGHARASAASISASHRLGGPRLASLEHYVREILQSGFPGLRRVTGRVLRAQLDGYLAGIVDRDFKEAGHTVRRPQVLRRWMAAYAAATSSVASYEKIRDAATGDMTDKPAKTTTHVYRDVLERLFILDPLPAWLPTGNSFAQLASSPKHHLADPALGARLLRADAAALFSGRPAGPGPLPGGTLLGKLFESLVTQSVRVYAQAAEAQVSHLRTRRGDHEIDLIIERDGGVLAVEVKLGQVPDDRDVRHLRWLDAQLGSRLLDSVVITTGPAAYRRPDGMAVVPAALLGP
ncbi:MAG: ATP-binding protein, partial [Streptosporangiaceae bacterium]